MWLSYLVLLGMRVSRVFEDFGHMLLDVDVDYVSVNVQQLLPQH